jgi:hypothetical protein
MAVYILPLSDSHVLEIRNDGRQTSVRSEIKSPGSHQVSQTSTTTGPLVSPPQYVSAAGAVILVFKTSAGEHHVRVEGGSISTGHFSIDRDQLKDVPGTRERGEPSAEEDATDRVCLSCGETVEERHRYCPFCGKRL